MKKIILITVLALALSPLFFFRLGQSSLTSFDEAWYAEIAKQLLFTGTPFSLNFNSRPFVDHPPAGFWLIASTQAIFGINEFGSRAAGAIAGLVSLVCVFIFGALLSHPVVGISSAIALSSSPWFIFRARSGNLDIFLTLFYLLTLLLAYQSIQKPKYLPAFFAGLSALILTKTASPFTILPALLFIFWKTPVFKNRLFLISLTLSLVSTLSYFLLQMINIPGYLDRLLFVGAPKVGQASYISNLILVKTYLHLGLGVWFKPAILSLPVFLIIFRNKKSLNPLIALIAFLLPFTLSPKTQIWHLIPAHPLLILILFGTVFSILKSILINHKSIAVFLTLTLALLISLPQIKKNWHEYIDIPAFVSDEAILSGLASRYPYPLVIDENFLPAAVFYSRKPVAWINSSDFSALAPTGQNTLIITHLWRLQRDQVPAENYRVLAADRDKVLILYNNVLK